MTPPSGDSAGRFYHPCRSSYDAEGYPCIEDHERLVPAAAYDALAAELAEARRLLEEVAKESPVIRVGLLMAVNEFLDKESR